jgi:succinyl-diaminopimelate desuccinylase
VLQAVKDRRATFSYDVRELQRVLPSMTEKSAPVVRTVARAISEVMGADAQYVVSPGTYDQKHIDRIGRLQNCIAYGPGILDLAHKPDEYVGIDDMLDSAKVMGRSLVALLAPEPAPPA